MDFWLYCFSVVSSFLIIFYGEIFISIFIIIFILLFAIFIFAGGIEILETYLRNKILR